MQYFDGLKEVVTSYLPAKQVEIIQDAYLFAQKAHDGQFRCSGEPYITHPVAVATILADMRLDYETIIAALLHDTIEDTPVTFQDITEKFGKHVAILVEGVSKLDKLKFRNRQEAQAENFRKMVLAMTEDVRVILIKLADRTHNMRTLGSLRPDKRRRIAKETLEIYAPLAHRLGIHHIKTELEILGFTAMHPNRAKVLEKVVDVARGTRKELIKQILSEIRGRLADAHIDAVVEGLEKNIYVIYQKMQMREQHFHSIMDIYIFRVVVKDVDACYRALGLVHNLYKPRLNRFKDYIAIPKANGYQSLHSSLIGPHGTPVEVQIRTEDMDQMAEMGVAAHWVYNEKDEITHTTAQIKAQRWMQSLLELQQSVGNSYEFIENVKSDLFPKEIYVFTPKGRIVQLPEGATAVDLAYAVHTDIGHQCIGAIVDRKPYPLSQPLSNGQTVEIITSPEARPNARWLSFVVSSKARSRIRQALKSLKREDAMVLGRRLLNLALVNTGGIEDLTDQQIKKILQITKLQSFDDVLAEIGLGNIMSHFIAKGLKHNELLQDQSDPSSTLVITGSEGVLVTFSKCCHPIPNDPIIGHVSTEKGLTVHHESCRNITGYQNNPDKYIPLKWATNIDQFFVAEIWVDILNNQGSLGHVLSIINDEKAHLQWLNTEEKDRQIYTIILQIEVKNSQQLNELIRKLSLQQDVVSVTRNIN
ncbi:bifunctional GTP diphosphokinase/guanosine-3',5'-bis(diphosphate) 3'-diphosphatase [Gilliamella apicola]|uniref:bifunctional GTP diphosphokinase/guanosine-3',5'-bis pyrophosphate 3'-pyrophosphohydrolase n=1 Tax=Gilliamella TaxID=1193503 RepID=UPI0008107C04|nr:bifunctional GTP diphosphokinase/guanosine-3',5'-bis pyrophosphate 3'-pyrophosphohydrolase [Gilliamella apicola]OCF92156.1 (p)ppGpp synthetase [Gilliamella apicola]OTP90632.1 bifunctional GTP diphosphokinase/guanosine-3',5'-bis(diphosphate) 3'-diphosphatase [Gilliamella apicola]OTP94235.1 bifunctional GTP diphosphokinase/guanosine-3',5'-bis(diphosphate) 3'-diphosphatase [Gilliamella apicola]OTP94704.1 bifunctional GTP diphosphokinase/guanosine-3',5'-bis(diphosphate) 3'-diphosphatase [Gilliam